MAEALTIEPIPIVLGEDGVMRVRGTRVTLDTVLSAFSEGATAEEIAQRYPSISLAGRISGNWLWFAPFVQTRAVCLAASDIREAKVRMSPGGRRTVSAID